MSISSLSNAPIELTFGGKALKLQRLSIKELFAPAETKIQQDYIKNCQDVAKNLTGKEKIDFLIGSTANMPKGAELDKLVNEWINTPQGIASLLLIGFNKCQPITEDELSNLMMSATSEELEFIKNFLGDSTEEDKGTDKVVDKGTDKKK